GAGARGDRGVARETQGQQRTLRGDAAASLRGATEQLQRVGQPRFGGERRRGLPERGPAGDGRGAGCTGASVDGDLVVDMAPPGTYECRGFVAAGECEALHRHSPPTPSCAANRRRARKSSTRTLAAARPRAAATSRWLAPSTWASQRSWRSRGANRASARCTSSCALPAVEASTPAT